MLLRRFLITLFVLGLASPALATGGFECRTSGGNLAISGTIGHVVASPLVAATLRSGSQSWTTTGDRPGLAIGRSWIDEREIRVDLVDTQATRFEAQLRALRYRSGRATGTLRRAGRSWRVTCSIE